MNTFKKHNDQWSVALGQGCSAIAGEIVTVTRRNGKQTKVTLGAFQGTASDGRVIYAIDNGKPEDPTETNIEALEQTIGPRGSVRVTSSPNGGNRGNVRKWLIASGVDSKKVVLMSCGALASVYNDTSNLKLNELRTVAHEQPKTETHVAPVAPVAPLAPVDPEPTTDELKTALEDLGEHEMPATAQIQHNGDLTAIVTALVTTLQAQQQTAAIDANRVREIMRAELPSLLPIARVEINTAEGTKTIEGLKHYQFADVLGWVAIRENVCLVGAAGSGKTTLGEQVAEALGLPFYVTGQLDSAFVLSGYKDGNGTYHSTAFRQAFEHGGVFIGDEMDGWDSNALLWVNGATANGYANFPDSPEPVKKHPDFVFIACCNTFGQGADRQYVGRNQLDAATLDRFVFIEIVYDEKLERALAANDAWVDRVQAIRKAVAAQKVRHIVSPRASIKGAKALAAGMSQDKVEQALIWKGLDKETVRRIQDAI